MTNQTFIEAYKVPHSGIVKFVPYALPGIGTKDQARPLTLWSNDEGGTVRCFFTFEEAQAVCDRYENGLDEDVREASWDAVLGEWEIIETFHRARSFRGEDFCRGT